jgi:hypothetical protein
VQPVMQACCTPLCSTWNPEVFLALPFGLILLSRGQGYRWAHSPEYCKGILGKGAEPPTSREAWGPHRCLCVLCSVLVSRTGFSRPQDSASFTGRLWTC